MTKADFVTSVRNSHERLKGFLLSDFVRQYQPLAVIEDYRILVLGGAKTYAELFSGAHQYGAYNIVLRDFSLFQFSFDDQGSRLAFLPNPYIDWARSEDRIVEAWDMVSEGAATFEEALGYVGAIQSESGIPLIRYEYARNQWKSLRHPCAHFHIGFHADNRWAVRRELTPLAFTLLIVKHYYGKAWLRDCTLNEHGKLENILQMERNANCRMLPLEFFSHEEEATFYFV